MIEKFPKKLMGGFAVAAGSLALTGCGGATTEHGTWKIGVDCPKPTEKVRIDNANQTTGPLINNNASFVVTCDKGAVKEAPLGLELLSGKGTTVTQGTQPTETITVDYTWKKASDVDPGNSPAVSDLIADQKGVGFIGINDVESINSVRVG